MFEHCATSSITTSIPEAADGGLLSAVTVLFSGGSDSTLTASLLSERFEQVHLLTFHHAALMAEKKCLKSLERLERAHGAGRFTHRFIDVNGVMGKMFLRPLIKDLQTYGTYALPMCCASCRLSMHVAAIEYSRERGIAYAADGANAELAELFPEQMRSVLARYRQLYARYGIEYFNPVFAVRRSDHILYDRGITEKRDAKSEHVVYSNQHSCAAGVMLYGYTLGVALPIRGRSSQEEVADRYVAAKIDEHCIPMLEGE